MCRFLCGPSRNKGNQTISSSQNFLSYFKRFAGNMLLASCRLGGPEQEYLFNVQCCIFPVLFFFKEAEIKQNVRIIMVDHPISCALASRNYIMYDLHSQAGTSFSRGSVCFRPSCCSVVIHRCCKSRLGPFSSVVFLWLLSYDMSVSLSISFHQLETTSLSENRPTCVATTVNSVVFCFLWGKLEGKLER
jgi:hypothetical protein